MNQSFGIYDVFVGVIPGALYLMASAYVALRLDWVTTDDLDGLNATLLLTVGTVTAYLLGQLLAPNLMVLTDRLPWWRTTDDEARAKFARRNPALADEPFVGADVHILLAGIHLASPSLADRIDRSRATGIMLRSVVPVAVIGALIALVEAVVTATPAGVGAAASIAGCGLLALKEGRKFGLWSRLSTLEAAAFVPDIDRCAGPDVVSPRPGRSE